MRDRIRHRSSGSGVSSGDNADEKDFEPKMRLANIWGVLHRPDQTSQTKPDQIYYIITYFLNPHTRPSAE